MEDEVAFTSMPVLWSVNALLRNSFFQVPEVVFAEWKITE